MERRGGSELSENPPNLTQHAEVSLGNILNPRFPLLIKKVLHIDAVDECVCELVNVKLYC